MKRKRLMVFLLLAGLLFAAGCQTAKGAAQGVGATVDGTAKGAVKDGRNLGSAIMALDDWIKRNLW
jgi:predicted small secreted protein